MSARRFVLANYRLRVVGLALGFLSLSVPFADLGVSWWGWMGCAFHGFVWPHIAHWRARTASDWQRAENANLLLDHCLGGLWISVAGFNALPSALMLSMMVMDSMICGGPALAWRGLVVHGSGTLLGALLFGFTWAPHTTTVGLLACLPLLLAHPAAVGFMAYKALTTLQRQRGAMEALSLQDPLSGLFNRRYFDQRLKDEFARCQRTGCDASLVLIDIDHFKTVNDTRGHATGDEAIQRFATLLRSCTRVVDVNCRYGGEEFGIVMPETKSEAAVEAMQRLRSELKVRPIVDGMTITASFGIVGLSARIETVEAWLRRADELLYQAKHSGRNTIFASGLADIQQSAENAAHPSPVDRTASQ